MRSIKLFWFLFVLFPSLQTQSFAQYGQMPPFTISIEAISGTTIPGLHSFAFAKSGDKWLIIGGRTNGLHGLNSSGGFPPEYKNDNVIIVDTTTWMSYAADLNQLPKAIADPMRSTNMQYIQQGSYLYMVGGYGWDSTATIFVTFPTLTAIHVDNMINAVINAQPIATSIRQVTDTNFVVCGGDLGKIGNDYYLCFGHDFRGRYSDPPSPLFTQVYSNKIKKFNMTDDGTTITLSGFTYQTDTNNFHRRDLNVAPIVNPDGSFGLGAYGGVFQKDINFPYREPITINAGGTTINSTYQQVMSQYTSALLPVYDSATQNMYTTFFGGISLYDYNIGTSLVVLDSAVPFISDVTTLTAHPGGTFEETVLPVQLPGLLGSNAKFVLNDAVARYTNDVIHIRNMPNIKTLAGYIFGGIRAQTGNFGSSSANDTVYRIYITPNNNTAVDELNGNIQNVMIFPNPFSENSILVFSLKQQGNVKITLLDIAGKEIEIVSNKKMNVGNHQLNLDAKKLNAGIYFCKIESESGNKVLKIVVNK